MPSRLIFLCARGSGRSELAASLLEAVAGSRFETWSTPTQDVQGRSLVEEVLHEQGIALLSSDRLIQPTFGMRWDQGVILCSGVTDT
jgi:protein-tyrosine-phosphatase